MDFFSLSSLTHTHTGLPAAVSNMLSRTRRVPTQPLPERSRASLC